MYAPVHHSHMWISHLMVSFNFMLNIYLHYEDVLRISTVKFSMPLLSHFLTFNVYAHFIAFWCSFKVRWICYILRFHLYVPIFVIIYNDPHWSDMSILPSTHSCTSVDGWIFRNRAAYDQATWHKIIVLYPQKCRISIDLSLTPNTHWHGTAK